MTALAGPKQLESQKDLITPGKQNSYVGLNIEHIQIRDKFATVEESGTKLLEINSIQYRKILL